MIRNYVRRDVDIRKESQINSQSWCPNSFCPFPYKCAIVVAIGSKTIFGIFCLFIYISKQNCLQNIRRKYIRLQHLCTNNIPLVPLVAKTLIGCVETRRTKSRAVNVISGLAAAAILFQLSAEKFQMFVYSTTIKPGVSIGHNILIKTRTYI